MYVAGLHILREIFHGAVYALPGQIEVKVLFVSKKNMDGIQSSNFIPPNYNATFVELAISMIMIW